MRHYVITVHQNLHTVELTKHNEQWVAPRTAQSVGAGHQVRATAVTVRCSAHAATADILSNSNSNSNINNSRSNGNSYGIQ